MDFQNKGKEAPKYQHFTVTWNEPFHSFNEMSTVHCASRYELGAKTQERAIERKIWKLYSIWF